MNKSNDFNLSLLLKSIFFFVLFFVFTKAKETKPTVENSTIPSSISYTRNEVAYHFVQNKQSSHRTTYKFDVARMRTTKLQTQQNKLEGKTLKRNENISNLVNVIVIWLHISLRRIIFVSMRMDAIRWLGAMRSFTWNRWNANCIACPLNSNVETKHKNISNKQWQYTRLPITKPFEAERTQHNETMPCGIVINKTLFSLPAGIRRFATHLTAFHFILLHLYFQLQ